MDKMDVDITKPITPDHVSNDNRFFNFLLMTGIVIAIIILFSIFSVPSSTVAKPQLANHTPIIDSFASSAYVIPETESTRSTSSKSSR